MDGVGFPCCLPARTPEHLSPSGGEGHARLCHWAETPADAPGQVGPLTLFSPLHPCHRWTGQTGHAGWEPSAQGTARSPTSETGRKKQADGGVPRGNAYAVPTPRQRRCAQRLRGAHQPERQAPVLVLMGPPIPRHEAWMDSCTLQQHHPQGRASGVAGSRSPGQTPRL